MKQTAVEFAIEKLKKFIPSGNQIAIEAILEQAKEMEKQQHQEIFKQARQAKIFEKDMPPVWESFDDYYKNVSK